MLLATGFPACLRGKQQYNRKLNPQQAMGNCVVARPQESIRHGQTALAHQHKKLLLRLIGYGKDQFLSCRRNVLSGNYVPRYND